MHMEALLGGLNPFRTPVPFWGQITWELRGVVPKSELRYYSGHMTATNGVVSRERRNVVSAEIE